jgi:hypothetical protein
MPQQLVQPHLHLKGSANEGGEEGLVSAIRQKGHARLAVTRRQHIGQGDILEAHSATDLVIVLGREGGKGVCM